MPPRAMTPSEKLLGRRMPAYPTHLDTLMASFIRDDGTACGRMAPAESWLKPAHRKARRNGWIRRGAVIATSGMKSSQEGIWYLTETGQVEARSARARVLDSRDARRAWSRDFLAAKQAAQTCVEQDPRHSHEDETHIWKI